MKFVFLAMKLVPSRLPCHQKSRQWKISSTKG